MGYVGDTLLFDSYASCIFSLNSIKVKKGRKFSLAVFKSKCYLFSKKKEVKMLF